MLCRIIKSVTFLHPQVIQCVRLYIVEPTYVSTHIVKQPKAEFPAITVCPLSDGVKTNVLKVSMQGR
jgi:hypothetical protein